MKKLIGYSILAIFFISFFVWIYIDTGILGIIIVLIGYAFAIAFSYFIIWLINSE